MDEIKREAILLIEEIADKLKPIEKGKCLILCVLDYLEDNDLKSCKRVLGKISHEYFVSEELIQKLQEDKPFADRMSNLMNVFGIYLDIFENDSKALTN